MDIESETYLGYSSIYKGIKNSHVMYNVLEQMHV
jgi:hypothetical protein